VYATVRAEIVLPDSERKARGAFLLQAEQPSAEGQRRQAAEQPSAEGAVSIASEQVEPAEVPEEEQEGDWGELPASKDSGKEATWLFEQQQQQWHQGFAQYKAVRSSGGAQLSQAWCRGFAEE